LRRKFKLAACIRKWQKEKCKKQSMGIELNGINQIRDQRMVHISNIERFNVKMANCANFVPPLLSLSTVLSLFRTKRNGWVEKTTGCRERLLPCPLLPS
jgi:hypothetical protein